MERADNYIIRRDLSLPDPPPNPRAHAPGRRSDTHQKRRRRHGRGCPRTARHCHLPQGMPWSWNLPSLPHAFAIHVMCLPKNTWQVIWKRKKSLQPSNRPGCNSWSPNVSEACARWQSCTGTPMQLHAGTIEKVVLCGGMSTLCAYSFAAKEK